MLRNPTPLAIPLAIVSLNGLDIPASPFPPLPVDYVFYIESAKVLPKFILPVVALKPLLLVFYMPFGLFILYIRPYLPVCMNMLAIRVDWPSVPAFDVIVFIFYVPVPCAPAFS